MTRQGVILTTVGSVAAISSTMAAGILWLLLSNPVAVANSAVAHEMAGQRHVAAAVLYDLVVQLVHLF